MVNKYIYIYVNIPLLEGFHACQVVQDFFHQQHRPSSIESLTPMNGHQSTYFPRKLTSPLKKIVAKENDPFLLQWPLLGDMLVFRNFMSFWLIFVDSPSWFTKLHPRCWWHWCWRWFRWNRGLTQRLEETWNDLNVIFTTQKRHTWMWRMCLPNAPCMESL